MKFSYKLSVVLLMTGLVVLLLLSFLIYRINYNSILKSQFLYTRSIAHEISETLDLFLAEKVKTSLTLANTPLIKEALLASNQRYVGMSDEKRNAFISSQNKKWQSLADPADNFVLQYTDNAVSHALKNQRAILKGEYGDIFLTNKFGALVAATSKLSTFAFGHEYWWAKAYKNGAGAVFFDDRGYDDRVGGDVLGLVVPVRNGSEIIGILKCNLNILGTVSAIIASAKDELLGNFKLSRSDGMIIFEEGSEPLTTRVHEAIFQKIKSRNLDSTLINEGGEQYLVGLSEVRLTAGTTGYGFGETSASVDHNKGDSGASCYVLCYRQLSAVKAPIVESSKVIFVTGAALIVLLVLVSFRCGRQIGLPLAILDRGSREGEKGTFEYRIDMGRDDEFGNLSDSFNSMASRLQQTATSIKLLQESEAYLQSIFRAAPIGIGVLSDSVLKQVNTRMCEITGYREEELIGQSARMLYQSDEDYEYVSREKSAQLRDHGTGTVETRWQRQDGSVVNVLLSCTPLDPDDLARGITFTALDITERKQIEESLKQNALEWSTAMDASDDALYLLDLNRHLLRANKSFYLMTGSDPQSAIGKHIEQIVHPEGKKTSCPVCLAQEKRRDAFIVMEADHPDNPTGRPIEITVKIVKGDEGQDMSIFMRLHDLSEQRKIENDLRQSKEEWERTFDSFTDIVTIHDTDLRILKANKAACTILDLPCDKIIRQHCYALFQGSDEPCPNCPLLDTRESFASYTREMYHEKLGKTFLVSAAPVFDKQGELEYIAHVAKDISKMKQLESQLFQAQKMEAIGTLASGIAHDFNNILSAIIGYAEFIQEAVAEESRIGKDIREVLAAGHRAADLVRQILTISRKSATEKQVLQPHLIVKEALKMLHATLPATVTIQEDIDPDCGRVVADPTVIHQIVVNLCTNGLQAMAEQKGILHVSLQRRELTAAEICERENVRPGPFVVLTVEDSGCGMDQQTIDRIFEPYFTTKEVGRGTGLGLAIVHGAVEEYKGFVEVESRVGKGTVFSVYLPATEEPLAPTVVVERQDRGKVRLGNARVLVVDDELLLVKINEKRLKGQGYQVTAVTDSRKALEMFRSQPDSFDLLVTDQTMPGLTGADLAKAVLEIRPSLPIILCTGHSDVVSEEEARALGIRKYVFKPLRGDELLDAVQEVLDGK